MKISEDLPPEISEQADRLMVDRRGRTDDAFMVTDAIIGHVSPNGTYRIQDGQLAETSVDGAAGFPEVRQSGVAPPHVRFTGVWEGGTGGEATDANILGSVGTLTLDRHDMEIPALVATPEAVGYYGASLIGPDDAFRFDTNANLPVTTMEIGRDYADGYLHVSNLGGGSYLEYHDRPHFHMPLDADADGCLLLGRKEGEDYLVTAFRIPFGKAVYTAPDVLHDDAYLTGKYLVIYSVTERFSNVVFRTTSGEPLNPVIRPVD